MDTSEFTDEQIDALQALADGYNDQSVSRRDVMKLVGAGGVGAVMGGGGAVAATEPASAGTAQSGQLGTPADRVDVFGEDVDATSVNTGNLSVDKLANSVAVVSPSQSKGYDSITAAINDGYDEIWLLEDISEGGIPVPSPGYDSGFRLKGIGDDQRVITDPNDDGTPIIDADVSSPSWNVTLENIHVDGSSSSGPSLDARGHQTGNKVQHWRIVNSKFTAGPVFVTNGIQCEWSASECSPSATVSWEPNPGSGTFFDVGCAVLYEDTTWTIHGGTFNNTITNSQGGENVALWLKSTQVDVGGSVVFNNAGESDGTNLSGIQLLCDGVWAMSLNSGWFEQKASVDYDISWTDKTGRKSQGAMVQAPNIGNGIVEVANNSSSFTLMHPRGGGTLESNEGLGARVFEGRGAWSAGGTNSDAVRIFPQTQRAEELAGPEARRRSPVRSSPPTTPRAGDYYLDDGTNTASGNLALRVYDGVAWVDQN